MRITGRNYASSLPIELEIQAGRIAGIRPLRGEALSATKASLLPWLAPGFVDLQINGYGGREFNDPQLTTDDVEKTCLAQDACGVTAFCPTLTTHSFEIHQRSLRVLATAYETLPQVVKRVIGFHVEGPYISPEDGPRGAHPREHCRPPDWDEFCRLQEAAGGRVRLLTLSPEYDGATAFIERAVANGVLVAIGHTAATTDQIRDAVAAGARLSTHLGNGAHPRIRRHPNYIWDQLAEDRLVASLIVDGFHLPPAVVKSFVRGKTEERCILVSDITGMAGMPPGRYGNTSLGGVEVLEDGRLVVAGQRDLLAGAALPIGVGVARVMEFAGVTLQSAVEMASVRPAQLIDHPVTRLEVGAPANIIQFHLNERSDNSCRKDLEIVATINHGEVVHGQLKS